MTTTTTSTETFRTVGRCKSCKAVNVAETDSKYSPKWIVCPCGKQVQTIPVTGRMVETVKCGPRCTSARGASCDCSCGGRNHCSDYAK